MTTDEQTERYEYVVYVTEKRLKVVTVTLDIPAGTSFDTATRKRAEQLAIETDAEWTEPNVKSTAQFWQRKPSGE